MRSIILAAILCAAACGSDDGGPIPSDDLSNAVFSSVCNQYVACGVIDDTATCLQLFGDESVDQDLVAAVHAGKVIYHSDKAGECLAGFGSSCDRTRFFGTESDACDQTFTGTVGEGGQCAIKEECISQDCDVPSCPDACCQGTCVGGTPPVKSQVGGPCDSSSDCSQSYCDFNSSTCAPYKPLGSACQGSNECAQGGCLSQMCTLLPDTGQACGTATTAACRNIGDVCSTTSMTCVKVGLSGDPCTSERDCSELYYCDTTMHCKVGPLLGDPCTGQCAGASYCDGTSCVARKPNNSTCQGDEECTSHNCDTTTSVCTAVPVCI